MHYMETYAAQTQISYVERLADCDWHTSLLRQAVWLQQIAKIDQLLKSNIEVDAVSDWKPMKVWFVTLSYIIVIYFQKRNTTLFRRSQGVIKPFLCPWGRIALSFGRVAQADRTNASCGPFAQWTERSQGCEFRIATFFQYRSRPAVVSSEVDGFNFNYSRPMPQGRPLYFCPVVSSSRLLLSFFFPHLISHVADWMSAILPHMVWP